MRRWWAMAVGAGVALGASPAHAFEVKDVGGQPLAIEVSNTAEVAVRFPMRGDSERDPLDPGDRVDDSLVEVLDRLYVRAKYWKFQLGVRADGALYAADLDRQDVQQLIVEEVDPAGDLELENRYGRELHARYTDLIYLPKLWVGFQHQGFEATVGDFYAQLGRGLVFSARKLDEVGLDTTVRGVKIKYADRIDQVSISATAFGGQMNPIRIDFPTGRILHGSGSPLFFGYPEAGEFEYFVPSEDGFVLATDRARPSYLEDNVIGGNVTVGTKRFQVEANAAVLLRQSNSEAFARCVQLDPTGIERCQVENPTFSTPEGSRSHDQIENFGLALRIPPIGEVFDGYVEVVEQHMTKGRIGQLEPDGTVKDRERDLDGFALYANVSVIGGPIAATIEGKHYRSFFPLGANIDVATLGFGAPEYGVVNYSQPPTAEHIFVETIGSRDVCVSGARGRVDARLHERFKIYGWVGRFVSWSEIDARNDRCNDAPELRSDTWDLAAGTEIEISEGTHYWGWVGARLTDREVPAIANAEVQELTDVFYREGFVRYDFNQHLSGDFSLSVVGYHRRRYEPIAQPDPWNEGENLLALNWNPHFSFIFGAEYQTRPGMPEGYFNGAIQYRSQSQEEIWQQLLDTVRVFVGQRRSALRCVAGVCRVFPAFEGARFELTSRF